MSMCVCVRGRKCDGHSWRIYSSLILITLSEFQCASSLLSAWRMRVFPVRVLCVGFLISGKSLNPGLQGKNTHTHTHLGMLWNHIIVHQDVYKRTRSPSRTSPPARRPQVCLRRSAALFDYTFRPMAHCHTDKHKSRSGSSQQSIKGRVKGVCEYTTLNRSVPRGGGGFWYVKKDGNILD